MRWLMLCGTCSLPMVRYFEQAMLYKWDVTQLWWRRGCPC